jgi:hypothetical protein
VPHSREPLPPKVETPKQRTITQSELNRLAQELEDLRNALRPFAIFAEALPPVIDGSPRLTDSGPAFTTAPLGKNYIITFADLRNARALLDKLEHQDFERMLQKTEAQMASVVCPECKGVFVRTDSAFCSPHCAERARYYASLDAEDFPCCGGVLADPFGVHPDRRRHSLDCENYVDEPG